MRRGTLNLILVASGAYYAIIFLGQGLLPANFPLPVFFLVGPLLGLVLILAVDLSSRATIPSGRAANLPSRRLSREVQQLSRRIEVGIGSSASYFENLLLARLRDILVERVSLETGIETERVRALMTDPRLGPGLVRNDSLYQLLYNPPPARGPARVKLLEDAAAMIEAWKA